MTSFDRLRFCLEQDSQPFYRILERIYGMAQPTYVLSNGQLTLQSDGLTPEAKALAGRCRAALFDLRQRYFVEMAKLGFVVEPPMVWNSRCSMAVLPQSWKVEDAPITL